MNTPQPSLYGASARIDVTPSPALLASGTLFTAGFWYARALPLRSLRDPLCARICVLANDDTQVAMVAWDSLGDGIGLRERIGANLAAAGVTDLSVFLTCTHAHTVPDTIHLSGEAIPEVYREELAQRLTECIMDLRTHLRPVAHMKVATAEAGDLVLNRRPLLRDGRLAVLESKPDPSLIADPGVVDDLFSAITLIDTAGHPLVRLLHWACHPVSMQAQTAISPGFPGLLSHRLERDDGNGCATLFLNGACGDINPRDMGQWDFAEALADELHRRITTSRSVSDHADRALAWVTERLPTRRRTDTPAVGIPAVAPAPATADPSPNGRHSGAGWQDFLNAQSRHVAALPECLEIEVSALRLGPVILAAAGGELFAETGLALRASAHGRMVLPVSYAHAYRGYLAPLRAYALGGYEVACAPWCPLAAGESERVIARLRNQIQACTEG